MTSEAPRAILLAAGSGERLRPFTVDTPKSLLPIGRTNFLAHSIGAFLEIGVTDFTFVVGYLQEKIISFVGEHFPLINATFISNPDFKTTNSGYSLWLGLRDRVTPFYFQDADLYAAPSIYRAMTAANVTDALAVDTDRSRLDEEAMKVQTSDGRIGHLSKKIALSASEGEFIGLGKFSGTWAQALNDAMQEAFQKPEHANDYYEDVMNGVFAALPPVTAISTADQPWIEVDTPEDYEALRSLVLA